MPSKGGDAGKAGDQYEALWTVEAALRIVAGHAEHVMYESLDPVASCGVEFNVRTTAGDVEFWSLKRQTTSAAGWTLALLANRDKNGRSILGDLIQHVERDPHHLAVFASTLRAAKLEKLYSVALTHARPSRNICLITCMRRMTEKCFSTIWLLGALVKKLEG